VRVRRIAGINAAVFFFFWLVVLLAGADMPPPIAFLWVVPVVALSAVVVYLRIPTYVNWSGTQKPVSWPNSAIRPSFRWLPTN